LRAPSFPDSGDAAEQEKLPTPDARNGSILLGGLWSAADWEAVAKGADDRGGGWPDSGLKLSLRRRHTLGAGDVQFDAALVGDVAHHVPPNRAAFGGSPIGPRGKAESRQACRVPLRSCRSWLEGTVRSCCSSSSRIRFSRVANNRNAGR